jgi:hypothetical protein
MRRICGGSIAVKPSLTNTMFFAAFTQRSESRRQSLQRAHDDVVANAFDLIGRISRVVLLDDVARRVIEFAAVEGVIALTIFS